MFGWETAKRIWGASKRQRIKGILDDVSLSERALIHSPDRLKVARHVLETVSATVIHCEGLSGEKRTEVLSALLQRTSEWRREAVPFSLNMQAAGLDPYAEPAWASAALLETWCMGMLGLLGRHSDEAHRVVHHWASSQLLTEEVRQIWADQFPRNPRNPRTAE